VSSGSSDRQPDAAPSRCAPEPGQNSDGPEGTADPRGDVWGPRRPWARPWAAPCSGHGAAAQAGELLVERIGCRTALLEGEHAALPADDVGVVGEVVGGCLPRVGLTELGGHPRGPHPAVAVPLGAAVAQPHPVHHALAEHPVVRPRVLQAQHVGPVAQVAPVEFARDAAGDREVERRHLLGSRGERALEEGEQVRGPALPCSPHRARRPPAAPRRRLRRAGARHRRETADRHRCRSAQQAAPSEVRHVRTSCPHRAPEVRRGPRRHRQAPAAGTCGAVPPAGLPRWG
jgi:hypothetical protein